MSATRLRGKLIVSSRKDPSSLRNLVSFWLLGLCNNFTYVIMLSAAHDILTPVNQSNITNGTAAENRTGRLIGYCNPIGTGAILLADILPALIVKLTAPLYLHLLSYRLKVVSVVLLNIISLLLVSFGGSAIVWLSILGVVFASCGSGLGEYTFLSLSAYFDSNEVSMWSSGTGGAGIFGALSYAGLTALHLSPSTTLLIMLVIPCVLFLTYFVLLVKPQIIPTGYMTVAVKSYDTDDDVDVSPSPVVSSGADAEMNDADDELNELTLRSKVQLLKPLLKFMIPLFLVYFAEYFINQALFELVYFDNIWLERSQQYRWFQVIYQLGVFISRSSVNVVTTKYVFIFAILQFANLAVFLLQIFFKFIPNIWIVFAVILFEGLMGGGAYVNSFYQISKQGEFAIKMSAVNAVIQLLHGTYAWQA